MSPAPVLSRACGRIRRLRLWLVLGALGLAACGPAGSPSLAVGQLESDRVEIAFEAEATIVERGPDEGSAVTAGTVLYQLDRAEIQAQVRAADAQVAERLAALAELTVGTRAEVLAQARADLAAARDTVAFRERELMRLQGLADRSLVAPSSVDAARTALEEAGSRRDAVAARFDELTAGPRPEAIERARAALSVAEAERDRLAVLEARHTVRTGIDGRLDRYLFEVGEHARPGAVSAIVLTGAQPHASVFLPVDLRAELSVGDPMRVTIEGHDTAVEGTIRWISSEAAFTPYFALTERDRGRLSYRAEIVLTLDERERLPDGLPVEAVAQDHE